eukprot:EG_transcript_15965
MFERHPCSGDLRAKSIIGAHASKRHSAHDTPRDTRHITHTPGEGCCWFQCCLTPASPQEPHHPHQSRPWVVGREEAPTAGLSIPNRQHKGGSVSGVRPSWVAVCQRLDGRQTGREGPVKGRGVLVWAARSRKEVKDLKGPEPRSGVRGDGGMEPRQGVGGGGGHSRDGNTASVRNAEGVPHPKISGLLTMRRLMVGPA